MDETYHLKFQPTTEEFEVEAYGSGPTLVQALAELEKVLIEMCGPEAAFEHHCCFLNRDITTIADDLFEVGGVFSCFDFSDPEGAFTITRIPPP